MTWVYFFGGLIVGFIFIKFCKFFADIIGPINGVEKFFGQGNTTTFWKLVGLGLIFFSFWALFNL